MLDLDLLTDKTSRHHVTTIFLQPKPPKRSAHVMIHLHGARVDHESGEVGLVKNVIMQSWMCGEIWYIKLSFHPVETIDISDQPCISMLYKPLLG